MATSDQSFTSETILQALLLCHIMVSCYCVYVHITTLFFNWLYLYYYCALLLYDVLNM